ncbi:MAG: saccharopine dehydrogenase family protein [Dehalococcoidia bacterium]
MKSAKRVVVLGSGRVGKAIAVDLSQQHAVAVVDTDHGALDQLKDARVEVVNEDATKSGVLAGLLGGADLVINALPGHLGFGVLKSIVELGKAAVDISFFPEDPFELDGIASGSAVPAVVDCGVAPGLSNMILGSHYRQMQVDGFACYVGGLPMVRTWPYQYRAPFSPIDVIEEYTRPARLVETGEVVVKDALSELEYLEFDGIGTLEAFNTDGLRTLLKTVRIPNMKEKTLRYPGHSEYMRVLRESGFFDKEPLDIGGKKIAPVEMTSRLLFRHWQAADDEDEYTVMRIIVEGKEEGIAVRYTYGLLDRFDRLTGFSSMARTTGFTCTAVANLVLEGRLKNTGIVSPELVGMDPAGFACVRDYLKERNVHLAASREVLS